MDFLPQNISEYAEKYTEEESDLLSSLNRETHAKLLMPQMLAGHLQGRVLSMLSHMIKPTNILEIGTFTGYSAICLSEGMRKDGTLITLDINEEIEKMARNYIEKGRGSKNIDFRIGNALEIIPQLEMKFDLVFMDADKENYPAYFDLCMAKMNKGSFLIADNVLWSGKVLEPIEDMDKDTYALHQFNEKIRLSPDVTQVLFPIRDGLMICRKN